MAATEREVLELGLVPCRKCGKPHDCVRVGEYREWGSLDDGHPYEPMTAVEVVRHMRAVLGIED